MPPRGHHFSWKGVGGHDSLLGNTNDHIFPKFLTNNGTNFCSSKTWTRKCPMPWMQSWASEICNWRQRAFPSVPSSPLLLGGRRPSDLWKLTWLCLLLDGRVLVGELWQAVWCELRSHHARPLHKERFCLAECGWHVETVILF